MEYMILFDKSFQYTCRCNSLECFCSCHYDDSGGFDGGGGGGGAIGPGPP